MSEDLRPYLRVKVRVHDIDNYPELLEAYKRSMGEVMDSKWAAEPVWETFVIYRYADDPLAPEDQHDFAILTLEGKW